MHSKHLISFPILSLLNFHSRLDKNLAVKKYVESLRTKLPHHQLTYTAIFWSQIHMKLIL